MFRNNWLQSFTNQAQLVPARLVNMRKNIMAEAGNAGMRSQLGQRGRPIHMSADAFAFFALIGTLCGAIGASAAQSSPYEHWMACLRRVSQNPLAMVFAQQSGMHGIPRGEPLLDPATMWVRLLLTCVATVIFMICRITDRPNR